ncbi:MAG: hypothetical protein KF767_03520 [Bdellovibrionaceae bacterium]|nr:hypothetical protein [Pseudobdellovibrionaceae bacterium]
MKIHQGSIAAMIGVFLVVLTFAFQNCAKTGDTDSSSPFQNGQALPRGEACTDSYAMSAVTSPVCTGGYTVSTATGTVTAGQPQLYIFGIYQTDASASHANNRAGAMTINVPVGSDPVHLVLVSYEPTKWTITGETRRVARVLVDSYRCNQVVGVNTDLIEYYSHDGNVAGTVTRDLRAQLLSESERQSLSEANKFPVMSRMAGLLGVTVAKAQSVYLGACAASSTFTAGP